MLFIGVSFYFISCEKDPHYLLNDYPLESRYDSINSDQLFELNKNIHPYLLEVYKDLKDKDLATGFTDQFISELGIPIWNKMFIFDSIPHQIYTITPIIDSVSQTVTGLLKVNRYFDMDFYEVVEKSQIIERINNINGNNESLALLKTDISLFNIFSKNIFYHDDIDFNNYTSLLSRIKVLEPRNVIEIIFEYWVWEECCYGEPGNGDCASPPGGGPAGHWVLHYKVFHFYIPGSGGGHYDSNNWGGGRDGGNYDWWNRGDNNTSDGGGGDSNSNTKTKNRNLFFNPLDKIVRTLVANVTNSFKNANSIDLTNEELYYIIGADCYDIVKDDDGVVEDVTLDEDCALEKLCEYNLESFETTYGLNLSQEEKDLIRASITDCTDQDKFYEEAENLIYYNFDGNESDEDIDPDLWIDCESFEYVPVGPGGTYQSCAVLDINIDVQSQLLTPDGIRVWWVRYDFNTIYFEFPRLRSDGTIETSGVAAYTTAVAVYEAEQLMQAEFENNTTKPSGLQIANSFTKHLRNRLRQFGARASKNPHYGYVPINLASYINLGHGNCH